MPNDQQAYDSWVRKQEAKHGPFIYGDPGTGKTVMPEKPGEFMGQPIKEMIGEEYFDEYYGKNDV